MYQSKHPVGEHLVAVRMNWLYWLARPVRWLWRFTVRVAKYLWSLVIIGWRGMRRSFSPVPLAVGAAGGAASFIVMALFVWLGMISGFSGLIGVGGALASLPIAWTCGEIASLMKYREVTGRYPSPGTIAFGNGASVAGYVVGYVLLILCMIAVQMAFDLLVHIPAAGPGLVALFLVPSVAASAVAIAGFVCLFFGVSVLPAHLLHAEEADEGWALRVYHMTVSYLKEIGHGFKWLRYLLLSLPAAFFGLLASIPISLLVGASLAVTVGVGNFMAPEAYKTLTEAYKTILPAGGGFSVTVFLFMLSMSLLAGAAFSAYFAACAASYYLLYGERSYEEWFGGMHPESDERTEVELDLL